MVVEFGHSESPRLWAWAELGSPWCCPPPSDTVVSQGLPLNAGWKGGLSFKGQLGALLEACFLNEKTQASQNTFSELSENRLF